MIVPDLHLVSLFPAERWLRCASHFSNPGRPEMPSDAVYSFEEGVSS